jgi:hypothetical protein
MVQKGLRVLMKLAGGDFDRAAAGLQLRREIEEADLQQAERKNDPKHRVEIAPKGCIIRCEYEYASGSSPELVRDECRRAAHSVLPDLGELHGDHQGTSVWIALDFLLVGHRLASGCPEPRSSRSFRLEQREGVFGMGASGEDHAGLSTLRGPGLAVKAESDVWVIARSFTQEQGNGRHDDQNRGRT